MKWLFFLILFCCISPLRANPWGKDADLVQKPNSSPICSSTDLSPLARFGEVAICFHQEVISPADGPRSHFIPSSSQYTLDAIRSYGFFTGVMMGCDRLMRENNDRWVYRRVLNANGCLMNWDPVRECL